MPLANNIVYILAGLLIVAMIFCDEFWKGGR